MPSENSKEIESATVELCSRRPSGLAGQEGLSKLSSMMIGFGIPISFVTLAIWYFVVGFI